MTNLRTPDDVALKITKLPIWAQDHINRLERERDEALSDLNTLKEGSLENAERQNFYTDEFNKKPFWLPQFSQLNFKQDPERDGLSDFSIRKSDHYLGGIEVRANLTYSRDLAVLPLVSNSVHIAAIER